MGWIQPLESWKWIAVMFFVFTSNLFSVILAVLLGCIAQIFAADVKKLFIAFPEYLKSPFRKLQQRPLSRTAI